MSERRQALKNLIIGYISVFAIVIVLASASQIIIQLALQQEITSRAIFSLLSAQGIYSQRLQSNALLLFGVGDHTATVKQMQSDLTGLESNHYRYKALYVGVFPAVDMVAQGQKPNPYDAIDDAAHHILAIEAQHLPDKQRVAANKPWEIQMFYNGIIHIKDIQQSQAIVDSASDTYIANVRLLEYILYGLNVLVWGVELFGVLIPTTRRFAMDMEEEPVDAEEGTIHAVS